jgi:hypothetical protein
MIFPSRSAVARSISTRPSRSSKTHFVRRPTGPDCPCGAREGGEGTQAWTTAAREADLPHAHSFARGVEQDIDAVTAAVTLDHHNGSTEGVHQTKLLKRKMYGRAGFALLRHRILLG